MLTFDEFCNSNPTYTPAKASKTARYVYDNIVMKPENRFLCASYSDCNLAALNAIAEEISKTCSAKNSDFKIEDDLVKNIKYKSRRNIIGAMVSESMRALGYLPNGRARVWCNCETPFSTGKKYKFDPNYPAEQRIKKVLEDIK